MRKAAPSRRNRWSQDFAVRNEKKKKKKIFILGEFFGSSTSVKLDAFKLPKGWITSKEHKLTKAVLSCRNAYKGDVGRVFRFFCFVLIPPFWGFQGTRQRRKKKKARTGRTGDSHLRYNFRWVVVANSRLISLWGKIGIAETRYYCVWHTTSVYCAWYEWRGAHSTPLESGFVEKFGTRRVSRRDRGEAVCDWCCNTRVQWTPRLYPLRL